MLKSDMEKALIYLLIDNQEHYPILHATEHQSTATNISSITRHNTTTIRQSEGIQRRIW